MKLKPTSLAAALLVTGSVASAAVVDFDVAGDLTSSFRKLRANANDSHQAGSGSNGSTAGFFRYNASADSGAIRYAYDANGTTTGTSTFTRGYVAMDVRWDTDNRAIGLWFGSPSDSLGWRIRLNNSTTLENATLSFGGNQTDNFTNGTVLTSTSTTAGIFGTATPAFPSTGGVTSSDTYSNVNLNLNTWNSMRLDFDLDGSNQRTLRLRVWDNVLDSNGVGTGTLRWDQSVTLTGTAYNTAGEVGFYAAPNSTSTANIDIDNFHAAAAIPEPSAFAALAGLGALGLVATRRRRRA